MTQNLTNNGKSPLLDAVRQASAPASLPDTGRQSMTPSDPRSVSGHVAASGLQVGEEHVDENTPYEPGKKVVCLGMPCYGNMTVGASRAFWRSTSGSFQVRDKVVRPEELDLRANLNAGSLLAQNCNAIWCWALNKVHRGQDVAYFAMLHSDVEPEDFWLDKLIPEMEKYDLDVLGVVCPIKDPKGLTSVALDNDAADTWAPLCRLTMKEVYDLPETFTSKDVGGHDILINTGCWVCRFNIEWAKKCFFTINDRIIFNTARDLYMAQVEPEDWFISRLFHELGLRVGATRVISLTHKGEMQFTNAHPWGQVEFDDEYVTESQIPSEPVANHKDYRFPYEVDGWLLPQEGRALACLAQDKMVLEIGSYCGKSTICLAQTATSVLAVDPHDGRGTPRPKNTLSEIKANIERYGLRDKVHIKHPDILSEVGKTIKPNIFDLIFIDGAHDKPSVKRDLKIAETYLAPGGLICIHDYRRYAGQHDGRWDPGVTEAVDEFLEEEGAEIVEIHATIAVVRLAAKPAEELVPCIAGS